MGKGFIAIAAMSENRVIGANGKIPWHIPDEFKWFKQATMGHVLVMGRKTLISIGKPLPGREIVVLSRQPENLYGLTAAKRIDRFDEFPFWQFPSEKKIFIAGGAEVYRQALPYCDEIYLTVVKRKVEGDVFFPSFEDQFELAEIKQEHSEFTVQHWIRRKAASATS